MYLAPLGAFGAMAYTVGLHGGATLFLADETHPARLRLLRVLRHRRARAQIAGAFGFSIFSILRLVREEFLLVLGTSRRRKSRCRA